MAHGIFNKKRDFQIAETPAWHKLTKIKTPEMKDFPDIQPVPLEIQGKPAIYGNARYFMPVAMDDGLPVAPPYCGETIVEESEAGCEDVRDKRGSYILFTPREAWAWSTGLLSGTGFRPVSIGMLWNRSFWFIGIELTELKSLSVGDGRESKFMLNFSGGLDRTVSPQCELSSIIPVCHNTISISRATGKVLFKDRATKNFADRLDLAKTEVEKAVGMTAVFKASMDSIAQIPCDKDRAERVFAGYLSTDSDKKLSTRTKNAVSELATLHVKGIGNRGETEFDLLNAYTERLTRGGSESKVSEGRRFASGEFGSNADAKADFYSLLTTRDNSGSRPRLEQCEERGERLLAAN
jgi:Domain of unknown function (DUF932)